MTSIDTKTSSVIVDTFPSPIGNKPISPMVSKVINTPRNLLLLDLSPKKGSVIVKTFPSPIGNKSISPMNGKVVAIPSNQLLAEFSAKRNKILVDFSPRRQGNRPKTHIFKVESDLLNYSSNENDPMGMLLSSSVLVDVDDADISRKIFGTPMQQDLE